MSAVPARHHAAVATVRAWGRRAGARRVVALIDRGDGVHAAMVEWEPDGAVELTEGDRTWAIAQAALDAIVPLPLLSTGPAPPASAIRVDVAADHVEAPIGALGAVADGLMELARALGGRSVATAEFATSDPELPITFAARPGDRVVLAIGDGQFELGVGE
jgi:hypothetical protein